MKAAPAAAPGVFAGKLAFASAGAASTWYLTSGVFKGADGDIHLPVMSATAVGATERCILYESGDGSHVIMQTGDLRWISFDARLGWLTLSDARADAIPLALTGSPAGSGLAVVTAAGAQTVWYTVANPTPLLTVNAAPGALSTFAPARITPSLADLRRDGGAGADLVDVDLSGASLDGIDFTGADLSRAVLAGASAARVVFTRATLAAATLTGLTADGAVFDGADLSRAVLTGTDWGRPASARGVVLAAIEASGATLGHADAALDCTGAVLTGADLRGARLDRLDLSGARLGGARLDGAKLDAATLDAADLGRAILRGASLTGATLTRVTARGANFIGADLSGADLSGASLGTRSYLFDLDARYATDLDSRAFPTPDLIAAFAAEGTTLSGQAPITIEAKGRRWRIDDTANGPFSLVASVGGAIQVFRDDPDAVPATLTGVLAVGARAPRAGLAGVNLAGARWYAAPATLDHADLEGADLGGALLVQTDFTQALVAGASFDGAVMVGATLAGALVVPGYAGRLTSFVGAQMQGMRFTQSTLLAALLARAAISIAEGVPLFRLPGADRDALTPAGLPSLAGAFIAAGYAFGDGAGVAEQSSWVIDNNADPTPTSPRSYRITPRGSQLAVMDGADDHYLFGLDASFTRWLAAPTAGPQLAAAFRNNGYSLAPGAPISATRAWTITAGDPQPFAGPVNYARFTVVDAGATLEVHGSTLLRLRDDSAYPAGVAFGGVVDFARALGAAVIGPAGLPYADVIAGRLDWWDFLAAS